MTPLSAGAALDRHYLEARSLMLDLAAILDRIDRGGAVPSADPRLERVRQALEVLTGPGADRAERVQTIFSLPYDPNWERPQPR